MTEKDLKNMTFNEILESFQDMEEKIRDLESTVEEYGNEIDILQNGFKAMD